jgi:hypothetical protein
LLLRRTLLLGLGRRLLRGLLLRLLPRTRPWAGCRRGCGLRRRRESRGGRSLLLGCGLLSRAGLLDRRGHRGRGRLGSLLFGGLLGGRLRGRRAGSRTRLGAAWLGARGSA